MGLGVKGIFIKYLIIGLLVFLLSLLITRQVQSINENTQEITEIMVSVSAEGSGGTNSSPTEDEEIITSRMGTVSQEANRTLARELITAYGWKSYWICFDNLTIAESNYNHLVYNKAGSGAYGIPQALPATKMASAGEDYMTNPETQIKWMIGYIEGRYGNPCQAWQYSQDYNWY